MSGLFITFEGGEGTGKSTQISLLRDRLLSAGHRVRILREPGGTPVGEAIRELLLSPSSAGMAPEAELLLYEAARAQLVSEVIRPSLEQGFVLLCDRFYDSTTAYQGYGRGLPLAMIADLNATATGGLKPDRTILLDVEVDTGLTRATRRGADRLESEEAAFHERVREGFLEIARREPERVAVVNAAGSMRQVASRVEAALEGMGLRLDSEAQDR